MKSLLALAILLGLASSASGIEDGVRVTGGIISGTTDNGVQAFKGIPFAAPPVGPLRWRPPQPVEPWEGVRACAEFGPACPQTIVPAESFYAFTNPDRIAEDCLFLNVWTDAESSDEQRPVMVWFHGGGLTRCSGADARFNGANLAKKGVVLVTVNYRLGPFGYLAHPELTREDPKGTSGNYGVLDQIAALRWVGENIEQFGGDASNVTIFGQSAGSWSVQTLVASPLAKGLFQRAIGQSGGLFGSVRHLDRSDGDERSGHEIGRDFLAACGVDSIADARALSPEQIIDALQGKGSGFYTRPVIDGWVLPESMTDIFDNGKQNDVPVMVGCTANEMTSLVSRGAIPQTTSELKEMIARQFAGGDFDEFRQAYGVDDDHAAADAYLALIRNSVFASQMRHWARATENVGSNAFVYYFTRTPPIDNHEYLRAHHSADVPYVFQNIDPDFSDSDRALADVMSDYWVNFATTGDPNGEGRPHWRPYTSDDEAFIELGSEVRSGNQWLKRELDYLERMRGE